MKKIIILALLFSGLAKAQTVMDFHCPTPEEMQLGTYYALGGASKDSELHNMIVKFKEDGAMHGTKVVFKGGTYYGDNQTWPGFWDSAFDNTIGVASVNCNYGTKWIRFSTEWWSRVETTVSYKLQAVYHELGHSYFDYSHSSTGIMRPGLNQTKKDYETDGVLNEAFLQAVSDLFNNVGQVDQCSSGKGNVPSVIVCNFMEN